MPGAAVATTEGQFPQKLLGKEGALGAFADTIRYTRLYVAVEGRAA
jgi:hypothetical protein